jgi:hypothetical protein
MEFVIIIAIGAVIWIYGDLQAKQKKAKTVAAFREEFINAFPAYASEISEGIAATIVADAYEKNGLAQKAGTARNKFAKRKDHKAPEENQSSKTKELRSAMVLTALEYHKQLVSRLPESVQDEINALPPADGFEAIMKIRNRAWARVS